MKTKTIIKNIFQMIFSLLIVAIFLKRFLSFNETPFVFKDELVPYVGELYNSRFYYFTMFTYNSILLYAIWLFTYSLSNLLNSSKFRALTHNKYIAVVVVVYQILTMLLYTVFEIFFVPTNFGLGISGNYTFKNYYNLFDSVFNHYIVTIFAVSFYLGIKKTQKLEFKKFGISLIYPAVYYIVVFTICRALVKGKWYPYQIFSAKAMWKTLFGSLTNFNLFGGIMLVVLSIVLIAILIAGLYILFAYISNIQNKRYTSKVNKVLEN